RITALETRMDRNEAAVAHATSTAETAVLAHRQNVRLLNAVRATQAEHSRRLDTIDGRLDTMDGRLDTMDGRLDSVDRRLDTMVGRLAAVEGRLDTVEESLDDLRGTLG